MTKPREFWINEEDMDHHGLAMFYEGWLFDKEVQGYFQMREVVPIDWGKIWVENELWSELVPDYDWTDCQRNIQELVEKAIKGEL